MFFISIFKQMRTENKLGVAVMSIASNSTELAADNPNTLTPEDVKIVTQNYTNDKSVRLLNYEIYDYSELKLGFGGGYKTLKITYQRTNRSTYEIVKFFVKSLPYDCQQQFEFLLNEGIFQAETNFYGTILPRLKEHYKCEKWHATCYLAKKDAIVMEDLRLQNYIVLGNLFNNFMAIKSVIASLARFHSCSIVAESRLSHDLERPVNLKDFYPDSLQDNMFTRTGMLAYWIYAGADLTCAVAESLNCNSDNIREAYDKTFDITKPSKTHRNVICHGSLWCNNLMFAGDGPLKNCILIDFQFIKYAPLVTDLLQILHLNSSRKFRNEYEKELLIYYHSVLQETIKSNDPTISINIPTLEEIIFGMKDLRTFGLVVATIYFPVVYMDSNLSSESFDACTDKYAFGLGDRFNTVLRHMKENSFFKNIIEEAVRELVEVADNREV